MSKNWLQSLRSMNRKLFYVLTLGGGLFLFAVSGWFWWQQIYMSPQTVFWDMLSQNMSTTGVTKRVKGPTQTGQLDQRTQFSLGSANVVHGISTIASGSSGGQKVSVTTETISTLSEEYVRYTHLNIEGGDAAKKPDFRNVLGVWGKATPQDQGQAANSRTITEALLGTVPIANLSAEDRRLLLKAVRDKQVFEADYNVRREKAEGRSVYTYTVKVKPDAYIEMLKLFSEILDLEDVGLDAEQYRGAPAITVTMSVDPISRQLVNVRYQDGSERTETYTGYGAVPHVTPPTNAIPVAELQSRIQKVQQ